MESQLTIFELPKATQEYLCTIFPRGWMVVYPAPSENQSKDRMVVSTLAPPGSTLMNFSHKVFNMLGSTDSPSSSTQIN